MNHSYEFWNLLRYKCYAECMSIAEFFQIYNHLKKMFRYRSLFDFSFIRFECFKCDVYVYNLIRIYAITRIEKKKTLPLPVVSLFYYL